MTEPLVPSGDGVRLSVHVQPGARRSELAGRHGDALKVRIAAPPVEGAANRELIRFLAEVLGVPRRRVLVVAGLGSHRKVVVLSGVSLEAARKGLAGSLHLP